jgi:hypothetical protein
MTKDELMHSIYEFIKEIYNTIELRQKDDKSLYSINMNNYVHNRNYFYYGIYLFLLGVPVDEVLEILKNIYSANNGTEIETDDDLAESDDMYLNIYLNLRYKLSVETVKILNKLTILVPQGSDGIMQPGWKEIQKYELTTALLKLDSHIPEKYRNQRLKDMIQEECNKK